MTETHIRLTVEDVDACVNAKDCIRALGYTKFATQDGRQIVIDHNLIIKQLLDVMRENERLRELLNKIGQEVPFIEPAITFALQPNKHPIPTICIGCGKILPSSDSPCACGIMMCGNRLHEADEPGVMPSTEEYTHLKIDHVCEGVRQYGREAPPPIESPKVHSTQPTVSVKDADGCFINTFNGESYEVKDGIRTKTSVDSTEILAKQPPETHDTGKQG